MINWRSLVTGALVFLFGFAVSELLNWWRRRKEAEFQRRNFFYRSMQRLVEKLEEDEEYFRFWGLDRAKLAAEGKSIKMAAYLGNLIDTYQFLYQHDLDSLVRSDYSVLNKILSNEVTQDYWRAVVKPHFYGSGDHKIVQIIDAIIEKKNRASHSQ